MLWEVKLYVAGKVFNEKVHAVDRNNAIDTAKARNPHAKVIGVNPVFKLKHYSCHIKHILVTLIVILEQERMARIYYALSVELGVLFITLHGAH